VRCRPALERGRDPFRDTWALPGGLLDEGETLEESIRRHLAAKVDVREVSHLEQLATYSDPERDPKTWEIATAYLGLVALGVDPDVPDDTAWHAVDDLPPTAFDHGGIVLAGRGAPPRQAFVLERGFAIAPRRSRWPSCARCTSPPRHEVSATNLRRVLERRAVIEPTGERRPRSCRRSAGRRVPLPRTAAGDHRPVRRAPPSPLTSPGRPGTDWRRTGTGFPRRTTVSDTDLRQ
jgi:8-oxo-dGTP diphosphatase